MHRLFVCLLLLSCLPSPTLAADSLALVASDFWQWRAREQPFTSDDIPRIERPDHFEVDWAPASVIKYRQTLSQFETRTQALEPSADAPLSEKVDFRLLNSALARVHWELDIKQTHRRDPNFYVDQSLGSVFELLLAPAPFSAERQESVIQRLNRIPKILQDARLNLTDLRTPFIRTAVDSLANVQSRLSQSTNSLQAFFSKDRQARLSAAAHSAGEALKSYQTWLIDQVKGANDKSAIGRDNYEYFLHNVALLPYTPEQLLILAQQEWSRSVAFEAYQQERLKGAPTPPIFANAQQQIEAEARQEQAIRDFLTQQHILTIPKTLRHYRNLLLPAYLEPLQDLGVTDDLTGPSRLGEDGISYIRNPSPNLGFFYLSTARDPRPIIVHEGVPGHYFQLCLSWSHPDLLRRHYYDSSANEGIGFYAEEMMLQAGLFDDNPQTRATLYSFMRLRALRVEVDVKLALGEFTLDQAADYLEQTVPMDRTTAHEEAAMFAATPGQAISYQIGKSQINALLADTKRAQGAHFDMQKFNDSLWINGNVPIALQRWESLGDASQLPKILPLPPSAAH